MFISGEDNSQPLSPHSQIPIESSSCRKFKLIAQSSLIIRPSKEIKKPKRLIKIIESKSTPKKSQNKH
jgi:hypothetical protein